MKLVQPFNQTMRILAMLFLALGTLPAEATCKCMFAGGEVEEGQTACIQTAKGPELARCGKFQNNSSWIPLGKQCQPPKTTGLPQQSSAAQLAIR